MEFERGVIELFSILIVGAMSWVELHPPKRYVQVLTHGTCDYDLIWQQGLC